MRSSHNTCNAINLHFVLETLKLCREERQKIIEGENNVEYTAPRIKIWDSRAKEILSKPSLRERFGNTDGGM